MSGAPSEADSEDTPEFQEQVQKLQKTWEVASLAQFFRTIGPYIPRAICPHSDLLEYELVKGVEEYLVGLMLPLLGLDEDADSDACWAKIQELQRLADHSAHHGWDFPERAVDVLANIADRLRGRPVGQGVAAGTTIIEWRLCLGASVAPVRTMTI